MMPEYSLPQIIRALGRGKKGTRDLTQEEAHFVMMSILNGEISGPQLGAILMLMRVKEETPTEIAGMVTACEQQLDYQPNNLIDINWPAYAGKKKQPSWYILAANLLAHNGIQILIHGGGEHTQGRQYAQQACQVLNIPVASNLTDAENQIGTHNISYISLAQFSPVLSQLVDMKTELGLRSPVNTLVRHLNPLNAELTLQGMFHPAYMPLHHESAKLLGQQNNIVLKGDGGEFEVRPDTATKISIHSVQQSEEITLTSVLKRRCIRPENVSLSPLQQLWNGEATDEYGEAAVLQTAALVYSQLKHITLLEALTIVEGWWRTRLTSH